MSSTSMPASSPVWMSFALSTSSSSISVHTWNALFVLVHELGVVPGSSCTAGWPRCGGRRRGSQQSPPTPPGAAGRTGARLDGGVPRAELAKGRYSFQMRACWVMGSARRAVEGAAGGGDERLAHQELEVHLPDARVLVQQHQRARRPLTLKKCTACWAGFSFATCSMRRSRYRFHSL